MYRRRGDASQDRKERMEWLLQYIYGFPEGIAEKRVIAITSINKGLKDKTILDYLDKFDIAGLIERRDGVIYPKKEEPKKE